MNPYRILGVSPSASPAEVKRAYRRRLKACHPDACGAPPGSPEWEAAHRATIALHTAYEAILRGWSPPAATPAAASASPPPPPVPDVASPPPSVLAFIRRAAARRLVVAPELNAFRLVGFRRPAAPSPGERSVWRSYFNSRDAIYFPHPLTRLGRWDHLKVGVLFLSWFVFLWAWLLSSVWVAGAALVVCGVAWARWREVVRRRLDAWLGVPAAGVYFTPDGVAAVVGREAQFFPRSGVEEVGFVEPEGDFYRGLTPRGWKVRELRLRFNDVWMVGGDADGESPALESCRTAVFDVLTPLDVTDAAASLRRVWAHSPIIGPPVFWSLRRPSGAFRLAAWSFYALASLAVFGFSLGLLWLKARPEGGASSGVPAAVRVAPADLARARAAAWFARPKHGPLAGGVRQGVGLSLTTDYPSFILVALQPAAEGASSDAEWVVVGVAPGRAAEVVVPPGRYWVFCLTPTPDHPQEKFQLYRRRSPLRITGSSSGARLFLGGDVWSAFERTSLATALEFLPETNGDAVAPAGRVRSVRPSR